MAWAQLVRLPNVFTVLADVGAAFLLVAGGAEPVSRLICVLLAGVALYWAGMILNDVFDVDKDLQERPTRPIPAGLVSLPQATAAGWGLIGVGVSCAALSGFLPSSGVAGTWLPAAIGVALAAMILLYDGLLKQTPLAPFAMGGCRVLSFLLGASPCIEAGTHARGFPDYVWGLALGFGIYIVGITIMARREAIGGESRNLMVGLAVMITGVALLALAPQAAQLPMPWHVSPTQAFPIMIGLIAFPVVLRAWRSIRDPVPAKIQTTIRVGILTIIPLAASVAMLGAGPFWGLVVFMLAIPSIYLSLLFRVT